MAMGLKDQKRSILIRCMKRPIKILAKARDLCFQNMSGGGGGGMHVFYGSGMSCPTPQMGSLSRSVSIASSNSSYSSDESSRRPSPMGRRGSLAAPVPRSQSVTIGRIDENKCCEFEVAYPRSRSCAAPRRSKIASGVHDFEYKRI